MKKLALFLLLAAGLFGADAANDILLTQRNPGNTGNLQKNVPAQNAITSASLPSFQEAIGMGLTDSPAFTGLTLSGQFTSTVATGTAPFTVASTTQVANLNAATAGSATTAASAAALSISGQTGLMTVTGLTSTNRIKTVRDAADTILELGGSYTPTGTWTSMTLVTPALGTPTSGVVTNLSGTASININGTVGATTPTTVAGTTGTFSGDITSTSASAGVNKNVYVQNTSNTAGSDATLFAEVAGGSAGDPSVRLRVVGLISWTMGVDNSDVGKFKIGHNAAVGTNTDLTIDASSNVSLAGPVILYNNIATAGNGLASIQGAGRATAQVGANASVATYTVGAADASFIVSANVLVTTATTHNFTVTCAYTDEGNTARTATFNFQTVAGVIGTAITNVGGAVPYASLPVHIRAKAATAITIATTGTFTTVTYNVEGVIQKVQ